MVTGIANTIRMTLTRGKFLDTLGELTEGALKVISNWADKWGLGVNPTKTHLFRYCICLQDPLETTFQKTKTQMGSILSEEANTG